MSNKGSALSVIASIVLVILIIVAAVIFLMRFNFGNISLPNLPIPVVTGSRNWAGYVAANNVLNPQPDVQGVSASWTVPSLTDIGSDAYSSIWIGIGGQYDNTLVQVGTDQDSTSGSTQFYAWYELLPNYLVKIDQIKVSPGDQISASISLASSNSSWTVSIEDLTSNTRFQNTFNYTSQQLTAEWIVERPEVNNALVPLADFGNVTFTNCQAVISGTTGGIISFSHSSVILDPQIKNNKQIQLVSISNPTNGGTEFTVSYTAVG